MQMRSLVGDGAQACGPDTTIREAVAEMERHDIGSLAVVGEGGLVGIFTERDVLRTMAKGVDADNATVRDWMTEQPDSIDPDVDVMEAARWILATGYRHLPVMEGATLLGIASIKDILWALTPAE